MQNPYRKPCSGRYHWVANQADPLTWTVPSHMNTRAQPPRPAGAFRAAVRLLLGLLPCSIFAGPALNPATRRSLDSRPYLTVANNLSIRFQEALPPPDLTVQPPAGAPPQPQPIAIKPAETVKPRELDDKPASAQPDLIPAPPPAETQPAPTALITPTPEPTPVAAPDKPAPAILPDDTKPQVHAEDFLPYFQFPGAHANPNDVTVGPPAPPVPGLQPPSSATYRQQ
jgi:hypothetical protein